jgi:hypothetical protein
MTVRENAGNRDFGRSKYRWTSNIRLCGNRNTLYLVVLQITKRRTTRRLCCKQRGGNICRVLQGISLKGLGISGVRREIPIGYFSNTQQRSLITQQGYLISSLAERCEVLEHTTEEMHVTGAGIPVYSFLN